MHAEDVLEYGKSNNGECGKRSVVAYCQVSHWNIEVIEHAVVAE
jgi:hypothetical protein